MVLGDLKWLYYVYINLDLRSERNTVESPVNYYYFLGRSTTDCMVTLEG